MKISLFSIFQPILRTFIIEMVITSLHVPPSWFTLVKLPPEFQLVNFLRLYQIIKMMREHHPMRYNRMTEIIKAVAQGLFEFKYFAPEFYLQSLPLNFFQAYE